MADAELSKKKKKKKEKKKTSSKEEKNKKRKRSEEDVVDDVVTEGEGEDTRPVKDKNIQEGNDAKETKDDTKKQSSMSKEERIAKKAKKKAEKEELIKKVPKTDEDGIAYTKAQIKRMIRRVKRGLDPVPTEEEERERLRQMKIDKKEEELELAGMLYNRDDDDENNEDENSEKDNENQDGLFEEDEKDMEQVEDDEDSQNDDEPQRNKTNDEPKTLKRDKKGRKKEVPPDFVCAACKNSIQPLHWIYDCPLKESRPGSNQVKKRSRGIHDPSPRKVFISGLPFEAKTQDVQMYFEKEKKCGKVAHCKLLQFEDTKRCKGSGFLTFETDEGAKNALKLNGTVLDLPQSDDINSKSSKGKKKQKELRLAVKKMLNRTITKKAK